MYVCLQACMPQTYTLTQNLHFFDFWMMIKRVWFERVCFIFMTGRRFSNIHTCSAHIFIYQNLCFELCMLERVCLIFDDRQRVFQTYIHAYFVDSLDSIYGWFCLSMYVCLGPPEVHTLHVQISNTIALLIKYMTRLAEESNPYPWDARMLRVLQTYIHTYIHTYILSRIQGLGPIPHEKRSVFDHQFNFLRFVRGGSFWRRHVYIHTYIHTYIHA